MPNKQATHATQNREDISQFVVHLTRDDRKTFSSGSSARENFLSILKEREIRAFRAHCIFNDRLSSLSDELQKQFKTACFTETPLNHIRQLVHEIPGRNIRLEPYGFVFLRNFVARAGGQPAIYVNSYHGNSWLRDGVEELYQLAIGGKAPNKRLCRILPFINAMHEKYDFSWEREWRIRNRLKFAFSDLVCGILPDSGADDIKDLMARAGIAAICPDWTYEQIVAELSQQQRATKSILGAKLKELTKGTKASDKNEES